MIRVDVRLYGVLRQYRPADVGGAPHHPLTLTIEANQSVDDVRQLLGIPDGLVAAVALNNEATAHSAVVQDGDHIAFFPPAAGGS